MLPTLPRVFDLDVLACPRCGGRLRVIATAQDPLAVQAILAHLARSHAPAPPGPAPPAPAALTSPAPQRLSPRAPDSRRHTQTCVPGSPQIVHRAGKGLLTAIPSASVEPRRSIEGRPLGKAPRP
jgi:uncharacterized protein YbaR (Trm112 family)